MIGKIFLAAAAVVGGIYLTSDEGKNARKALLKRKAAFDPIIKDLLAQAKVALEGAEGVNVEDVRANVNKLINEARTLVVSLDFDKTVETIREAVAVAARKIREANALTQSETSSKKQVKKAPAQAKTKTVAATRGKR